LIYNQSFAVQAKDYFSSVAFYPVLSLFAAIVVIYAGGWLRLKGKSWIVFGIPFAIATGLYVLSAVLSLENLSRFSLPVSIGFVVVSSFILLVEAILVWRFLTRGGRQAIV
jgi:hypothetical protein